MKLPTESLNDALKERSMSTIRRRSHQWFEENYISRTKEPPEEKRGKLLEVGKMYTYNYDPKHKDILAFYDYMPMMLCIGHIKTAGGKLNAMGINMSYIPPKVRPQVLDKIVKTFKSQMFDFNEKQVLSQKFSVMKKVPLDYGVCKKILKDSGFEFAVRSYIYTRMKTEPRVITASEWWKMMVFPSQFIEEMNIRAIYAEYKKSLDPNYRIGRKDPKIKIAETNVKKLTDYLEKRNKQRR